MGREIERKFLVADESWRVPPGPPPVGVDYRQSYLSTAPESTVRVRLAGDRALLTIKGLTVGATRPEFEYAIPVDDAVEMLDTLCGGQAIEKTRYRVTYGDHVWELDVFHGANSGLVVAEIELQREDETFKPPSWLGQEVTSESRYYNSNLMLQPYSTW